MKDTLWFFENSSKEFSKEIKGLESSLIFSICQLRICKQKVLPRTFE
jgi:hypothetical protein